MHSFIITNQTQIGSHKLCECQYCTFLNVEKSFLLRTVGWYPDQYWLVPNLTFTTETWSCDETSEKFNYRCHHRLDFYFQIGMKIQTAEKCSLNRHQSWAESGRNNDRNVIRGKRKSVRFLLMIYFLKCAISFDDLFSKVCDFFWWFIF